MVESTPLVSVIIPAFNASVYIESAVKSAIAQTYKNIEIIIIDDGSTDDTFKVAKNLSIKYSNVKAYTQINGRQGKARNFGIKNSSGEFIAFLDADDEWLQDKIEIQLKHLFKQDADLVFSDGYLFVTDSNKALAEIFKTTNQATEIGSLKGIIYGKNGVKLLHLKNRIPTSSVLCKKSAIENVGFFDTQFLLHEDYMLWLKLTINGYKLVGIEEKLFLYRFHSNSSTYGFRKQLFVLIDCVYEMGIPITTEQKIQIIKHSKSLFEDLNPTGEIKLAKGIMEKYAQNAAGGLAKYFMKFSLSLNLYNVFLSLFYRESRPLFEKQIDERNLILPLQQANILK